MNNKLGISIQRAFEGLQVIHESNKGNWSSALRDIRNRFKYFSFTAENPQQWLRFLSTTTEGVFLVEARPLTEGRAGDYIAAWIFIPKQVNISGEELLKLANQVRLELSKGTLDFSAIDILFSKAYPDKDRRFAKDTYKSSAVGEASFAYRRIGETEKHKLEELLGSCRYQSEYSNYQAVYLVDSSTSVVAPSSAQFQDLTTAKLKQRCIIELSPELIDKLKKQAVSILWDGGSKPENYQIKDMGDKVTFTLQKKDFEVIPCGPFTFDTEVKTLGTDHIDFNENTWKRTLTSRAFCIRGEKGEHVQGTITLKGRSLGNRITFTEKELKAVQVKVTAPKYEDYSRSLDLTGTTDNHPYPIKMNKKEETYKILLGKYLGGEFELKTKYLEKDYPNYSKIFTLNQAGMTLTLKTGYSVVFEEEQPEEEPQKKLPNQGKSVKKQPRNKYPEELYPEPKKSEELELGVLLASDVNSLNGCTIKFDGQRLVFSKKRGSKAGMRDIGWRVYLYCILFILLGIILGVGGKYLIDYCVSHNRTEQKVNATEKESGSDGKVELEQIETMFKEGNLSKAQLDACPQTIGLYDALNSYNKASITKIKVGLKKKDTPNTSKVLDSIITLLNQADTTKLTLKPYDGRSGVIKLDGYKAKLKEANNKQNPKNR